MLESLGGGERESPGSDHISKHIIRLCVCIGFFFPIDHHHRRHRSPTKHGQLNKKSQYIGMYVHLIEAHEYALNTPKTQLT